MVCVIGNSEKWKRRTRTIQQTRDPRWNQSFVFAPIRLSEVRSRILQGSVWDCDRSGNTEYLGETSIELSTNPLDDEPEWHFLIWDVSHSLIIALFCLINLTRLFCISILSLHW